MTERHTLIRPVTPGQLIAARIKRRPWLTLKGAARLAGMKPKRLRGLIADRKKLKWIDIYGLAEALNVHPNGRASSCGSAPLLAGILLVELMEARHAVREWEREESRLARGRKR